MSGGARRRRRRVRIGGRLAAMLVLGLAVAAVPAVRLTVDPHPEAPEHVDALLVLYSSPHVFDAAIELVDQGGNIACRGRLA